MSVHAERCAYDAGQRSILRGSVSECVVHGDSLLLNLATPLSARFWVKRATERAPTTKTKPRAKREGIAISRSLYLAEQAGELANKSAARAQLVQRQKFMQIARQLSPLSFYISRERAKIDVRPSQMLSSLYLSHCYLTLVINND